MPINSLPIHHYETFAFDDFLYGYIVKASFFAKGN